MLEQIEPITLPGSLEILQDLRDYVTAAAERAGLDSKRAYRLTVAVDEIAENAIIHGFQRGSIAGTLRLSAELDETTLRVILEDDGPPFDPARIKAPKDLNRPVHQRKAGGLGIYLTRLYVDDFHYARAGEYNRNVFEVRREPTP